MHEFTVARRLREVGVREYVAVHASHRRSSRSKLRDSEPLFPGYVFCFLDLRTGPRLYAIPGVLRIVGHGGRPMPIEDKEMALVRSIADSGLPVDSVPALQCGDRILLTAGPLEGLSGMFVRSAQGNKFVVSLPLLQRSLAIRVPSEWVAPQRNPC